MPRYFQSLGAGRPLSVGGRSFIFEPVEPMGGSWAGVLAVDDESAANILAAADLEITEEQYNTLKKKQRGTVTVPGFVPSQTPPRLPPQPIVVSAVAAEDRSAFTSSQPQQAPVEVPASSISLATTSKQPPPEPLLENATPKRRKSA